MHEKWHPFYATVAIYNLLNFRYCCALCFSSRDVLNLHINMHTCDHIKADQLSSQWLAMFVAANTPKMLLLLITAKTSKMLSLCKSLLLKQPVKISSSSLIKTKAFCEGYRRTPKSQDFVKTAPFRDWPAHEGSRSSFMHALHFGAHMF